MTDNYESWWMGMGIHFVYFVYVFENFHNKKFKRKK